MRAPTPQITPSCQARPRYRAWRTARAWGECLASVEDVLGGDRAAALDTADENVVAGLDVADRAGLADPLACARGVAHAHLGVRIDAEGQAVAVRGLNRDRRRADRTDGAVYRV